MVFDTTLRDGEQTPGVNLSADRKFELGIALDDLGVDVIEAGFPASSDGERELFRRLSSQGLNAKVCGLCRASKADIDAAIDSGANYVHVFLATSELHMKYKLKMTPQEVLAKVVDSVSYVRSRGVPCEFSAEDASRSDVEFLKQVYVAARDSGACMLNVPDTVGVSSPSQYASLIRQILGATNTPISVHAHNDFGLAVANTLAGVEAGASQVQVTINGLGERAGNAALEETVMALSQIYGVKTGIRQDKLYKVSQQVSRATRVWPSPNKAIIGDNAFSHSSGVHVHGVLSHALAYEPFEPEVVGRHRRIVLGKLTGTNAVKNALESMGFSLDDEKAKTVTAKIKAIGDAGRRVHDFELAAMAREALGIEEKKRLVLEQVLISIGNNIVPIASVKARMDGQERMFCATGAGPVDAAMVALSQVSDSHGNFKLDDYKLMALSEQSSAQCEVTVTVEDARGNACTGFAVSPDIVMASVSAMTDGINHLLSQEKIAPEGKGAKDEKSRQQAGKCGE